MTQPERVLIVGGGYVGLYTALHLQRALRGRRRRTASADGGTTTPRLTVVDPHAYMTYQPFLPEAAAGSISPRHVVVPLRRMLPDARIVTGEATAADPDARTVTVATRATEEDGEPPLQLPYDVLVVAPGSVAHTVPVPGLAAHGMGFKSVEEAIGLRNHVLEQLDVAASTRDPEVREAALTFVFAGAGYAGVEALAELEDMARHATRHHTTVRADDLRWILLDAADRILPEAGPRLAGYVMTALRRRRVDVRLRTRLASVGPDRAVLSDGTSLPTRTLVWTTGVRPHPVLGALGLKLDEHGRIPVGPDLRTHDHDEVFAAGDCAAVPDLAAPEPGTLCAPNAQHALRQARTLAANVLAHLDGRAPADYRHRSNGAVISLGLHKGAAHYRGIRARGYPAWLLHRIHHLARMPTPNRKARILTEWLLSGLLSRETVSLGALHRPPSLGAERFRAD